MHDLDASDEPRPAAGRHRAPPSPARRAAVRLSLGVASILVAAGLGVLGAEASGLAGRTPPSPGTAPDAAQAEAAVPTFRRTIDLRPTPTTQSRRPPAVPPAAEVDAGTAEARPAADAAPPPDPGPAAAPARQPPPVPTVRPGEPCSTEGATGMTAAGKPAVCGGSGDGPTRWRPA